MALPVSSSFFSGGVGGGGADGGSNGRQLIVFAGDKGLVAMDAGRGVVVQELTGAGADEVQDGSGDGGSGSGGGSGGVSHVAVTPDGRTVISVGDGDVSFGLFGVFAPRRLAVSCLLRALAVGCPLFGGSSDLRLCGLSCLFYRRTAPWCGLGASPATGRDRNDLVLISRVSPLEQTAYHTPPKVHAALHSAPRGY